jgi:oligopeptide transport system permease protein
LIRNSKGADSILPKQLQYILKRLVYSVITVLVLITITFFLMHLMPGDPFTGTKAIQPEVKAALYAKYGLDKPLPEQFIRYVGNVLHGDFGVSLLDKRPVKDIIMEAFPVSAELGIRSLIFAFIIGLLLGIVAAVKRGTGWDTFSMFLALIGVSVPSFVLGAILQYFLGLKLYQATGNAIFPVMGWSTENSKLLPAFALAFGSMAVISRLMRTSMLDVLNQDYIKTAKAKGLSQSGIVWKHAVRNAIMPVVTVMGPMVASVLTGTFVIENIFAIPGLGKYFVQSVQMNDYTTIVGTTLFFGAFLVFANFVVDIIYGLLDPRIKLSGEKE